jgi:hypothetical protein
MFVCLSPRWHAGEADGATDMLICDAAMRMQHTATQVSAQVDWRLALAGVACVIARHRRCKTSLRCSLAAAHRFVVKDLGIATVGVAATQLPYLQAAHTTDEAAAVSLCMLQTHARSPVVYRPHGGAAAWCILLLERSCRRLLVCGTSRVSHVRSACTLTG